MKVTDLQLRDYINRIGIVGPLTPDLETLKKVVEGHSFTFPFETISVHDAALDHRPNYRTSLKLNHLHRKLVHNGRGGRCVELNHVLQSMLKKIGFNVIPILADDLYLSSHLPKAKRPKHSAAIVKIGSQEYLIDAAFGGLGIMSPLPLVEGIYKQYSEKFKLIKGNEYPFEVQAFKNETWYSLYGFDSKRATLKDYQALNKKNANPLNPNSIFKTFFACTLPIRNANQNARVTIVNENISFTKGAKKVHEQQIGSQQELHQLLEKHFRIDVKGHYLRYQELDMQAYQMGIHRPPFVHRHPTRLQTKYLDLKSSLSVKADQQQEPPSKNRPPSH